MGLLFHSLVGCFSFGMIVHNHVLLIGLQDIINVVNELIRMNVEKRRIDYYCRMLDKIRVRNHVSWNSMVFGFALNHDCDGAIKMFQRLEFELNLIMSYMFLNAISYSFWLDLGRQLHEFVLKWGCDGNMLVCNGLVDFYSHCKEIGFVEMVFYEINGKK